MLVLGIKTSQTITIDENIKITFLKVRENTIRVAIDAPKEVSIVRDGVEKKKKVEGQ